MLQQRVKPLGRLLADSQESSHSLKKSLGPISLIAMGIGAIIGTGIFVLTGVASAKFAGPSLTVSFIISGVVSAFAAPGENTRGRDVMLAAYAEAIRERYRFFSYGDAMLIL